MNSASILHDLKARGLISQTTPGLEEHLKEDRTLYCGFDPTADSLHIGSLVPLLTLRRFQQAGHTPIILVGGATGLIGDPSFKAQERKLNTEETVHTWADKLKAQTSRFVDFSGTNPAKMANNYEWTQGVSVLAFLRDVGKHFSVNNLISKEAIKSRLEREDSGISYTEFTYPLLQAFDFQQLHRTHNCTIQIGGSDQWGNMTAGTELLRKTDRAEAHVLTLPLVTKSDGTKFGKTESGTIWLSAEKTSPYAFYQFWLNTADADIEKFLCYFTFKDPITIKNDVNDAQHLGLSGLVAQSPMPINSFIPEKVKKIKIDLAEEITTLVHGEGACHEAQRISEILFNGDIATLTGADFTQLATGGLPTTESDSLSILDAIVLSTLASSKREARDFLKQNAIQHNGEAVTDEALQLTPANAKYGKYHLLRRGKKQYALLIHA